MSKVKILIVEDEAIIAEDIAYRLDRMGYEVVGIVGEVNKAIDCLSTSTIDIVLIDIALLGNETGIDLAQAINREFHLPFIFLTSLSDKNTIERAGKTKPAAYLLKPFNDNQIRISIELALFNYYDSGEKKTQQDLSTGLPVKMFEALFLKKDTHYDKVEFSNILWLEAESNYTLIHTKTDRYIYSNVLKNFEGKLPPDMFLRVHRSFIVNLSRITGFVGNSLLIANKQIPVNRASREEVFKRFQVI